MCPFCIAKIINSISSALNLPLRTSVTSTSIFKNLSVSSNVNTRRWGRAVDIVYRDIYFLIVFFCLNFFPSHVITKRVCDLRYLLVKVAAKTFSSSGHLDKSRGSMTFIGLSEFLVSSGVVRWFASWHTCHGVSRAGGPARSCLHMCYSCLKSCIIEHRRLIAVSSWTEVYLTANDNRVNILFVRETRVHGGGECAAYCDGVSVALGCSSIIFLFIEAEISSMYAHRDFYCTYVIHYCLPLDYRGLGSQSPTWASENKFSTVRLYFFAWWFWSFCDL